MDNRNTRLIPPQAIGTGCDLDREGLTEYLHSSPGHFMTEKEFRDEHEKWIKECGREYESFLDEKEETRWA